VGGDSGERRKRLEQAGDNRSCVYKGTGSRHGGRRVQKLEILSVTELQVVSKDRIKKHTFHTITIVCSSFAAAASDHGPTIPFKRGGSHT
jgi:hypothetical protein